MKHGLRRCWLTTHIAVAVGWIGAVCAYLVLVVSAMTGDDVLALRSAWIGMELIGWYLIVPLAVTSLVTGCVVAVGTPWGLFRHYWVVVSLALTAVATAVLVQHMPTVSAFARAAADPGMADVGWLRGGLPGELLHAGGGLLVLLAIEALNVYKPQGMTAYGRRTRPQDASGRSFAGAAARPGWDSTTRTVRWVRVVGFHAVALGLLFVLLHLTGVSHD